MINVQYVLDYDLTYNHGSGLWYIHRIVFPFYRYLELWISKIINRSVGITSDIICWVLVFWECVVWYGFISVYTFLSPFRGIAGIVKDLAYQIAKLF